MPGTAFSAANWQYYQSATGSAFAAAHTDFTLIVDISDFSAGFGSNVQSDGGDIRCTKADGTTELPFDLIDWDYNGGSPTGFIRVKFSGAGATGSANVVRVWYGYTGGTAVAYDASETYGSNNAYDSNWWAYYPLHDLNDRTSNARHLSAVGTPPGVTAGKVGDGYEFDGAASEGLEYAGANITGGTQLTIMGWGSNQLSGGGDGAMIGSDVGFEMALRNAGNKVQFVLNSFSTNDRATGATTIGSGFRHWAGRYNGSTIDVFYEGAIDASVTPTGAYATFSGVSLGVFGGTASEAVGVVDDVQVHTTGRASEWIADERSQANDNATWWGAWSETDTAGGSTGNPWYYYAQVA
jgi:hypothetical protein